MQSTGIIRRFDDLGRIVIPKEFRKKLNHGESDMCGIQMEICMDGENIVLRKYEAEYEKQEEK